METTAGNSLGRRGLELPSDKASGAQIFTFQRLEGGRSTLGRSEAGAKRRNVGSDLDAASEAFKADGNTTALAARLRIILAKLRGGK